MRARLAAEIEALRSLAGETAWVSPGNLHVTLKFLGRIAAGRLPGIETALAEVGATAAPFELAVQGLGAFPAPTRARVIWAGAAAGADAARQLAAVVDGALAHLGFAREARAFTPHVTLGRVREPRFNAALAAALAAGGGRAFGHARVERVSLMRSELSPRGARHTELRALPLVGPPSA